MRIRGMTNRTLAHFRRDGQAKRAYSRGEALEQASKHRKNAYRCPMCGAWHVGGVK